MQRNNRGISLLLKYFFVTFFFSADISVKSETYQKEGGFILEEENQVFGVEAENKDDFNSEEKFNIYLKDKEDAEKNIQASAKELNDFFDSLI